MNITRLVLVLSFSLFIGCSNDKDDTNETRISGYYKIISFQSTTAVDMNNDGVKSNDLFAEISGPHHTPDNQQVSFYDFQSYSSYMEVRPLANSNNDAKFVSLNIPEQYVAELNADDYYLGMYLHSGIFYSYRLDGNSRNIELIDNNPDFDKNSTPTHFEIQTDKTLKLELTNKVFDFVDSKWVELDATIVYKKVDL